MNKSLKRLKTGKKSLKRIKPKEVVVGIPELDNLLNTLAELKAKLTEDKERWWYYEEAAIELMRQHGVTYYEGSGFTGDLRQAHPISVDWEGLERKLKQTPNGSEKWAAILEAPQPSKEKLEAMVSLGKISPDLVQEFMTEGSSKPYVMVTPKKK